MAYIQVNLMSGSLMRTVNLNVILPTDKLRLPGMPRREDRPYPTLYLLHGILGSHVDWINGTKLQRWAEEKDLAVVMPAGENSFYIDREQTHELYGQFIGRELVEQTRRMFPLSRDRQDTFIGGLSMGGYGALRNGLKYHDTFGRIIALSSANVVAGIENRRDDAPVFFETRRFAEGIFGDLTKLKGSDKDILWLTRKLREEGAPLPAIYMACGVDDSLLAVNRGMRDCFLENGYDLTYAEGPGGHEWDFWNDHIKRGIDWLPLDGTAGINSGHISA